MSEFSRFKIETLDIYRKKPLYIKGNWRNYKSHPLCDKMLPEQEAFFFVRLLIWQTLLLICVGLGRSMSRLAWFSF